MIQSMPHIKLGQLKGKEKDVKIKSKIIYNILVFEQFSRLGEYVEE